MSGSRTPNAVRSSSSTAFSPNRTSSGNAGSPIVTADGRHSSTNRLIRPGIPAGFLLDEHAQDQQEQQDGDQHHDETGDRVEAAHVGAAPALDHGAPTHRDLALDDALGHGTLDDALALDLVVSHAPGVPV